MRWVSFARLFPPANRQARRQSLPDDTRLLTSGFDVAGETARQMCNLSAVPRAKTEARAVAGLPGLHAFGIGNKASNLGGTMP